MRHYAIRHKTTGKYLAYVNQNDAARRKLEYMLQPKLWATRYGIISNLINLNTIDVALENYEIVTFDVVITRAEQPAVNARSFFDNVAGDQHG